MFSNKTLLVIGGGIMQVPLISTAISPGIKVAVVDMNPDAPGIRIADIKIPVSTRDIPSIVRYIKERKIEIDVVLTVGTDMSYTVAMVGKAIGARALDERIARLTTNKYLMRRFLKERGILVPDFCLVSSYRDLERAISEIGLPLVIKPVDNMGARGVILLEDDNKAFWHFAFNMAKQNSLSGKLIAEKYIPSYEFSVDALVYNREIFFMGIADRIIALKPFFVELGHTMPSIRRKDYVDKVKRIMEKIKDALSMEWGALKGDIFISKKDKRAYVGEVASRLSGGFMSGWTFPLATSINLMENLIYIAFGYPPKDVNPEYNCYAIERAIWARREGRIKNISGILEAKSILGVREIFLHRKVGDKVAPPKSNLEKIANIIVSANTYKEAKRIMRKAIRTIRIEVE